MKREVAWHKECLGNARASALATRREAQRLIDQASDLERQCITYDAQIIRAEQTGVTEFDRDKFGKSPRASARGKA